MHVRTPTMITNSMAGRKTASSSLIFVPGISMNSGFKEPSRVLFISITEPGISFTTFSSQNDKNEVRSKGTKLPKTVISDMKIENIKEQYCTLSSIGKTKRMLPVDVDYSCLLENVVVYSIISIVPTVMPTPSSQLNYPFVNKLNLIKSYTILCMVFSFFKLQYYSTNIYVKILIVFKKEKRN